MFCNKSAFITVINDYLRLTGVCHITLGQKVANDAGLVADIRGGAEVSDTAANAILDHVLAHLGLLTDIPVVILPIPVTALAA